MLIMPPGTMTLSNAAIASISEKAGDNDVTVEFRQVEVAHLTDAQKAAVGQDDMILDINLLAGAQKISEFDGILEMTVPYSGPLPVALWYLNDAGELERLNCTYNNGLVNFSLDHLSLYVLAKDRDWVNPFTDVKASNWYYDAIAFVTQRGIAQGTTASTFSPDHKLTRGQFITMLLRAYDIEPKQGAGDNFNDGGNTYYTGYLAAAKIMGIASGIGNNNFAPERDITRQEMFTMLHRALDVLKNQPSTKKSKTLTDFSDSHTISPWAKNATGDLLEWGIVTGSGGRLAPLSTTTRAQMAQVLYNLFAAEE